MLWKYCLVGKGGSEELGVQVTGLKVNLACSETWKQRF